jgi:hypothetical protein
MTRQDTLLSGWSRYTSVQKLAHPENNPDSAKPEYWLIPTEQQIQQRAYERYEQRRRTDRHDLEDWLQAECEINGHAGERGSGIASGSPPERSWVSAGLVAGALGCRGRLKGWM